MGVGVGVGVGLYFRVTKVFGTFLTDLTFSVFEKKMFRERPKNDEHKRLLITGNNTSIKLQSRYLAPKSDLAQLRY